MRFETFGALKEKKRKRPCGSGQSAPEGGRSVGSLQRSGKRELRRFNSKGPRAELQWPRSGPLLKSEKFIFFGGRDFVEDLRER